MLLYCSSLFLTVEEHMLKVRPIPSSSSEKVAVKRRRGTISVKRSELKRRQRRREWEMRNIWKQRYSLDTALYRRRWKGTNKKRRRSKCFSLQRNFILELPCKNFRSFVFDTQTTHPCSSSFSFPSCAFRWWSCRLVGFLLFRFFKSLLLSSSFILFYFEIQRVNWAHTKYILLLSLSHRFVCVTCLSFSSSSFSLYLSTEVTASGGFSFVVYLFYFHFVTFLFSCFFSPSVPSPFPRLHCDTLQPHNNNKNRYIRALSLHYLSITLLSSR